MDYFELELNLELIEFWRGEYAKRRYFLENEQNYTEVCQNITQFQAFAREVCMLAHENKADDWDVKACELDLLESVESGQLIADLPGKRERSTNINSPAEILKWAYDESMKSGYVVSDLLMDDKERLVSMAQSTDETIWPSAAEVGEAVLGEDANALRGYIIHLTSKEWGGPRFFGPNAFPAHRLKCYTPTAHGQVFASVQECDEPMDFMMGIKGLYAEDFNLDVTVREAERQLFAARFAHFAAQNRKIVSEVEAFARRAPEMESVVTLFDQGCYKEWNREHVGDSDYELLAKTILDHWNSKYLTIEGARFLAEDLKSVKTLLAKYRKVKRILGPLVKRMKKLDEASEPQSSAAAEKSRACGLYLWDRVYIDGKKRSEALADLREFLGVGDDYSSKDYTTMYRWLRIINRCIRENLFLSMSGS